MVERLSGAFGAGGSIGPQTDQDVNSLGSNLAGPLDDSDRKEALEAIERYINSYKVGDVHSYVQPFTDQFRQDIRTNYREDEDKFKELNDVLRNVTKAYKRLCVWTGVWLCVFLFAPVIVFGVLAALSFPHTASFYYIGFGSLAAAWIIMATVRRQHRKQVLENDLIVLTTTAAERASHRIVEIISTLKSICAAIPVFDEQLPPGSWADRGGELCKIAMWYSDRAQGLDHFATTVYWKIRNALTLVECLARLCSGLLLVLAIGFLLAIFSTPEQRQLFGFLIGIILAMLVWVAIWYFTFVRIDLAKSPPAKAPNRWPGFFCLTGTYVFFAGLWLLQAPIRLESMTAAVIGLLLLAGTWWPWLTSQHPNNKLGIEFSDALRENLPKGSSPVCHYDALSGALAHLIGNIVALRMPLQGSGWRG